MDLRGETPEHPLPALTWRPMTPADLDAVAGIAGIGFPDHFEGRDCFENRLSLWPQGCFVLADGADQPIGYLVAYPWRADDAPALNTLIAAIPDDATVMYLHDLCLHPNARGRGSTAAIVERLADQARAQGWPALALVAVNDATGFWARHGFVARESEAIIQKLAGYGSDARYMFRPL